MLCFTKVLNYMINFKHTIRLLHLLISVLKQKPSVGTPLNLDL